MTSCSGLAKENILTEFKERYAKRAGIEGRFPKARAPAVCDDRGIWDKPKRICSIC